MSTYTFNELCQIQRAERAIAGAIMSYSFEDAPVYMSHDESCAWAAGAEFGKMQQQQRPGRPTAVYLLISANPRSNILGVYATRELAERAQKAFSIPAEIRSYPVISS